VLAVYDLCKTQIIVAPMGSVVGLRMGAALTAMGWLGVMDRELCWRKLQAFCEELFKKDK